MSDGLMTADVTVSFGVSARPEEDLSISLDEKKNREYYAVENKTSFFPNEVAFLKVISSSSEPFQLYTSLGSARISQNNVFYEFIENVSFELSKEGKLQHTPHSTVNYKWLSRPGTGLSFVDNKIFLSQKAVALLQCEYRTIGTRVSLNVSESQISEEMKIEEQIPVIVVVVQGNRVAYIAVNYEGEGVSNPIPVHLRILDFCSDLVIGDVDVYVDEKFVGKTNSQGTLYLGMMYPETVHTLLMTKEGYVNSDLDVLYNDSFTVPRSSDVGGTE